MKGCGGGYEGATGESVGGEDVLIGSRVAIRTLTRLEMIASSVVLLAASLPYAPQPLFPSNPYDNTDNPPTDEQSKSEHQSPSPSPSLPPSPVHTTRKRRWTIGDWLCTEVLKGSEEGGVRVEGYEVNEENEECLYAVYMNRKHCIRDPRMTIPLQF